MILRTKTAELLRVLKKMLLLLAKMEERPSLEVTKKKQTGTAIARKSAGESEEGLYLMIEELKNEL